MHKLLLAAIWTVLIAAPAGAADVTEPMAVVHQWVDGFNRADVQY